MEHYEATVCDRCNGSGSVPCPHCDDGFVAHDLWAYTDEPFQFVDYCPQCGGSGRQDCPTCNGVGLLLPVE